MRLKFFLAGALTLSAATAMLFVLGATAGSAHPQDRIYHRCRRGQLSVRGVGVRGTAGGSLNLTYHCDHRRWWFEFLVSGFS